MKVLQIGEIENSLKLSLWSQCSLWLNLPIAEIF
jgi:hypothetical protein